MSVQMLAEINAALDEAEKRGGVVILTGREKMFSGGFDLSVFKAGDKGQTYSMLSNGARLAERLETTEKANDVQRRMLEAAARRPRDRDELADRLRNGRF